MMNPAHEGLQRRHTNLMLGAGWSESQGLRMPAWLLSGCIRHAYRGPKGALSERCGLFTLRKKPNLPCYSVPYLGHRCNQE